MHDGRAVVVVVCHVCLLSIFEKLQTVCVLYVSAVR